MFVAEKKKNKEYEINYGGAAEISFQRLGAISLSPSLHKNLLFLNTLSSSSPVPIPHLTLIAFLYACRHFCVYPGGVGVRLAGVPCIKIFFFSLQELESLFYRFSDFNKILLNQRFVLI